MNKLIFKVKAKEKEYSCYLVKRFYAYNGSLKLLLIDLFDDEPYASLTVCLGPIKPSQPYASFVDVNNWPKVEEFIIENNLGKKTGRYVRSGFVIYPEYVFNEEIVDIVPFDC